MPKWDYAIRSDNLADMLKVTNWQPVSDKNTLAHYVLLSISGSRTASGTTKIEL